MLESLFRNPQERRHPYKPDAERKPNLENCPHYFCPDISGQVTCVAHRPGRDSRGIAIVSGIPPGPGGLKTWGSAAGLWGSGLGVGRFGLGLGDARVGLSKQDMRKYGSRNNAVHNPVLSNPEALATLTSRLRHTRVWAWVSLLRML